eukprot:CAMPEP_0119399796 /NCGR_PEP_ID=MMETSP1334-20130426/141541_1 /TAXON_ID=127549 /ORGANISM="Calcidiscus leptoporus, Strain RCC1130" /LENGTH=64 /DNA_ID=CAMNT_0007423693 /DNA_START=554 /DNA_END=748 /DNA_ORIENTATION=+
MSGLLGRTDGHSMAWPLRGATLRLPSAGKSVSPPASTSLKYMKNVKSRGPHAESSGEIWSWWTL